VIHRLRAVTDAVEGVVAVAEVVTQLHGEVVHTVGDVLLRVGHARTATVVRLHVHPSFSVRAENRVRKLDVDVDELARLVSRAALGGLVEPALERRDIEVVGHVE